MMGSRMCQAAIKTLKIPDLGSNFPFEHLSGHLHFTRSFVLVLFVLTAGRYSWWDTEKNRWNDILRDFGGILNESMNRAKCLSGILRSRSFSQNSVTWSQSDYLQPEGVNKLPSWYVGEKSLPRNYGFFRASWLWIIALRLSQEVENCGGVVEVFSFASTRNGMVRTWRVRTK